jgi:hypothetical protein
MYADGYDTPGAVAGRVVYALPRETAHVARDEPAPVATPAPKAVPLDKAQIVSVSQGGGANPITETEFVTKPVATVTEMGTSSTCLSLQSASFGA